MSNFNTVLLRYLRYRQEIAVLRAEQSGKLKREIVPLLKPIFDAMAPRVSEWTGAPRPSRTAGAEALTKILVVLERRSNDSVSAFIAEAHDEILLIIDDIEKMLAETKALSAPEYIAAVNTVRSKCGVPTEDERAIAGNLLRKMPRDRRVYGGSDASPWGDLSVSDYKAMHDLFYRVSGGRDMMSDAAFLRGVIDGMACSGRVDRSPSDLSPWSALTIKEYRRLAEVLERCADAPPTEGDRMFLVEIIAKKPCNKACDAWLIGADPTMTEADYDRFDQILWRLAGPPSKTP